MPFTRRAGRCDPQRLCRSLLSGRPQAANLDRARRRPPLRVRRPVHLHRPGMPALRRPAHRDDDHVPMRWLPIRHHHRSRDQRPSDRGTQRLRDAGGRKQHSPSLGCFEFSRPVVICTRLCRVSAGEKPALHNLANGGMLIRRRPYQPGDRAAS